MVEEEKKAAPGEVAGPEAESVAAPAAQPAPGIRRAAWAAPLHRFDRAWTKLDARLAAGVLVAEILTLVFWIALKSLASTGRGGPGMVFRALALGAIFGGVAHLATRKRTTHHEIITTGAVLAGVGAGMSLGEAGTAYFANILAWIQNASVFVFFGGASSIAKRLTLWLALLGASIATGQGKHINVDVVMRFLSPRARVPLAVLGWMTAAIVCFLGVWGFFDHVAVEDYRVPTTIPCAEGATAEGATKYCRISKSEEISKVAHETGRDAFLFGRQVSLDLRSLPHVLGGTQYNKWLTPKEWNGWVREGGWEKHFAAEDVKAMELPEDEEGPSFRTPAVTSIPGGSEQVHELMVRELNFVFAFGLLVIALRFVIRSILAIAGWVDVDPNAAHGDDELAEAHDPHGKAATLPPASSTEEVAS